MKILNKEEMKKMPNGTVFMLYQPEILDGEIHIITGKIDDHFVYNGELLLTPFFDYISNDKERITNWCTTDNTLNDYDDNTLFAVFNQLEIIAMIKCLQSAIDPSVDLSDLMDIYFKGDEIIEEKDLSKYTDWK